MTECPRCGRELDPLLRPECDCPTTVVAPLEQPDPILYPTMPALSDAGVRRFVDSVLDELEDD